MGFLDASKAESGEIQCMESPVALNRLIQEVAREEALEMFSSGITLNLELDPNLPEILGDVLQVERVLWNLLSNAIKFTPRNGRIEVKTASAEGQVRVMIRDTGVGIATEDLPLLFSEYRRLKGSGSTKGSGLGLYIVKNILKAMVARSTSRAS
jgi:signal transduction histidine kinase